MVIICNRKEYKRLKRECSTMNCENCILLNVNACILSGDDCVVVEEDGTGELNIVESEG